MKSASLHEKEAERWLHELVVAVNTLSHSQGQAHKVSAPDRDVLLEAVKKGQYCLRHLEEQPDDDILIAAVIADSSALSLIKNQSEAGKLAAIKNNRDAIDYIDNPSVKVQVLALTHGMKPGYFDSENLACFSDKFTDEALATISGALVLMRQLYDGDKNDILGLVETYDSFQPFDCVALSEKVLPEAGLSAMPCVEQRAL